jgi:hypothetical protein
VVRRRRADGEFPVIPPDMDFRPLSRNSDKILTTVTLYTDYDRSAWIKLGEIQLHERDNNHRGAWMLSAYLLDATDFEHDSAHLLKMELVGVVFTAVEYGQTRFEGFIRADDEDTFRVGGPDYNPLLLKGTTRCKRCRRNKTHPIVPEGHYVPPLNAELFNIVRGRRVEVVTGVLHQEED